MTVFQSMLTVFFDKRLMKFLIVGVANTLVGAGLMFLLYNVFGCSYWISSACNYIAGGILSFFLNKFFTFKNKQKSARQIFFFIALLVVCYLVAYVGAKQAVFCIFENLGEKTKGNIAMCAGIFLYTGLNYIGQRFFVFKEDENA